MIKGPLADRLEYAILEVVFHSNGDHQTYWGGWETQIRHLVSDYANQLDLLAAFKRLWQRGVLRLTKPHNPTMRHRAFGYSGRDADDHAFFFIGNFNAEATPEGRSYWDRPKEVKPNGTKFGFPQS